jgi:hypothetical protein
METFGHSRGSEQLKEGVKVHVQLDKEGKPAVVRIVTPPKKQKKQ